MAHFDYSRRDAAYPIRPDFGETFRSIWEEIARPGNWWSGRERVAIVDEVRRAADCAFCAERKQALSPYSIEGRHDRGGVLAEAAVDAVHRIVTDQARLSREWVAQLEASGVSDGHYVELLGVVVAALSIDEFHRILSLPLEPLPTPQAGEPSKYRPGGLDTETAWVPMLNPSKIGEAETDLFSGGRVSNVARALSLVPDVLRMTMRLSRVQYIPLEMVAVLGANGRMRLDRMQIETVAGRVSALNECFY